jgi:hypothetical protein
MGWHDERERLLADTLAFVQSVGEALPPPAPSAPIVRSRASEPRRSDLDIHREMQERLSAFHNRQRLQEIERNVYYEQAMQRIRAVTEQWA